MDHGDAAGVLRRHAPLIGVLTLAGLVGALALVLLQSAMLPRHQATASFYVSTTASSVLSDVVPVGEDPQEGARPVDSFASVVTAPVVLRPVIARLGCP